MRSARLVCVVQSSYLPGASHRCVCVSVAELHCLVAAVCVCLFDRGVSITTPTILFNTTMDDHSSQFVVNQIPSQKSSWMFETSVPLHTAVSHHSIGKHGGPCGSPWWVTSSRQRYPHVPI